MTRKTRRRLAHAAASLLIAACPSIAQHAGYLADLRPWMESHPVKAIEVIASGRAWCQWCGEAYRLDRLGWGEVDGLECLLCDDCYTYLLTICE